MNFVKINIHQANSANAPYTYNGYYIPRIGEKINFAFAGISGTVADVTWKYANEVDVTVSHS